LKTYIENIVTCLTQGRRQDVAAGGTKNYKGGTFLNTMLDACSNRHEKVACKVYSHLFVYFDPESYTDMNAEPAEHRRLMFCNLDKCRDKK